VQLASGAIASGCQHNGCSGHDWHALWDLYEPGWRAARDTPLQVRTPSSHNGRHQQPQPQAAAPTDQRGYDPTPEQPAPVRFNMISAKDLYAKDLPEQECIVDEILPVGATLFTGRGKDGKSLMAWNFCMAVASNGTALGQYSVKHGAVLYLALEDGERRAQKRLKEQMQCMEQEAVPEGLDLVLWEAPRIGAGGEEALTAWLDEHPDARLVVIDILEKVRPRRTHNGSVYADDYLAIAPLQRIAQERNIAILIVHHSNKTRPEDFRDTASGSMGLIGACDTF